MTGVQPIYMMVAQAQSGAELGDAILQAPIETLDDNGLYGFMEGGGVVYQALASADPNRAVEYFGVRKAFTLVGADASRRTPAAVLDLKQRLAAVLGGINGTWPGFKRAFDLKAHRMNLFGSPAQMRAQAAQALCGNVLRRSGVVESGNHITGEIEARPASPNHYALVKDPERVNPHDNDDHFDRLLEGLIGAIRTR